MTAFDLLAPSARDEIDAVVSAYDPGVRSSWVEFIGSEVMRAAAAGLGSIGDSDRTGPVRGAAALLALLEGLGAAGHRTPVNNGFVLPLAVLGTLRHSPGQDAVRLEHIERVLGGTRYATCITDPAGVFRPDHTSCTATLVAGNWQLNGSSGFVAHATDADVFLVTGRLADDVGGVMVFAVAADAPGVRVEPIDTIGDDHCAFVHLVSVETAPTQLIGRGDDGLRRAVDVAVVALCAEMVGAARALIERTAEHVRTRKQFGAALSTMQVVQHRMADMAMDYEIASGAVLAAVSAIERGASFSLESVAAKAACASRCARIAVGAHQLGGGQGYLAGAGLHGYTRLLKSADSAYEPVTMTRMRLAALLSQSGWKASAR